MRWTRVLVSVVVAAGWAVAVAQDFTLTVIHHNDTHSRIEPAIIRGKPYGGFARSATLIDQERRRAENPLVLHAGDAFQGTLYFNVYEGLADLAVMNAVGYHAMAVGNHEFDRGPKPLGLFAQNANFPLLAANLDVSAEPSLKDVIKPSIVVSIAGERVAIVGAVTDTLNEISSPGPTVKLLPVVASVQAEVDKRIAEGINKIVLLSHCGFDEDREAIRKLKGVDIVVGGHSHTLLGNATAEGWPASRGAYPTLEKNADGDQALVVQAWEWGKALGRLKVTFDAAGKVKSWAGSEVLVVGENVPEDPFVRAVILALQRPIIQLRDQAVSSTTAPLERSGQLMGELVADAQLMATAAQGVVVAFMNPGGIRSDIDSGTITYGEAISVQPFSNTLVVMDLTGAQIQAMLEQMAGRPEGRPYLRVSKGSSYSADFSKPIGSRISKVVIAGAPLETEKIYRIVVNSFMAGGGDGLTVLKDSTGRRVDTGLLDIDAFVDFLKARNPLTPAVENRVTLARN